MSKASHPAGSPAGGPLLIIVSGPSGAGKDSLLLRLQERGVAAHFTVTATTRPKREATPADHAFLSFLSDADFDRLLANDGLLEHAEVYGYHYGVPKAPVRDALARGQDVLMRIDVQGAATVKRLLPGAVLVFLVPPSPADLEVRLRARGLDDEATIARRLEKTAWELAQLPAFDYAVVNEDNALDAACDQVLAIMTAERCRVGRTPVAL